MSYVLRLCMKKNNVMNSFQSSLYSCELQVDAPLLIMLGADDMRVPPKQGREYFRALKARNKITR